MIIIKYNFLASYTKKLQYYYSNFIKQNNISYGLKYSHSFFNQQKFKEIKIFDFKNKRIQEIIEKEKKNIEKYFYIESIEDSTYYGNDILKTLLYEINSIPIVFLVIPGYYNRLKSLIFRSIISINSKTDINDILIQNFKKHCEFFFLENINFNNITFEKIILLKDLEELIYLHNNKKINLICITETGVDKPEIYFSKAGLPVSNITFINDNKRMKKDIDIKKLTFFNDFIKNNKTTLEDRYREIFRKLEENNIEVVS